MQDMDSQASKSQVPNAQAPRKLSFLRGNEGLASVVEMDIDLPEKKANFVTRSHTVNRFKNINEPMFLFCPSPSYERPYRHDFRKHYLPMNCYGCGIRFDSRPTSEDKIPASEQHFYFYNEKVYCSFACRQLLINIEIPSLATKDDKDGASTANAASATTPWKSNPRTGAPARRS